MHVIRPASSDDMVLAFLRAEIDSPSYRDGCVDALNKMGVSRRSLIDTADLNDAEANRARAFALGCVRGFGRNKYLFEGFPTDTQWRRVQLVPSDFYRLKYLKYPLYLKLTNGTRAVEDGARNYRRIGGDEAFAARVNDIVDGINNGVVMQDLILIEDEGCLIVVEGNTRVTAYVAATASFSALVGTSPTMRQWVFI